MSYEDYLDVAFFMNMCVAFDSFASGHANVRQKSWICRRKWMRRSRSKSRKECCCTTNGLSLIGDALAVAFPFWRPQKKMKGYYSRLPRFPVKSRQNYIDSSCMYNVENKSHSAFDDHTMISAATKASRLFWQKKTLLHPDSNNQKKEVCVNV